MRLLVTQNLPRTDLSTGVRRPDVPAGQICGHLLQGGRHSTSACQHQVVRVVAFQVAILIRYFEPARILDSFRKCDLLFTVQDHCWGEQDRGLPQDEPTGQGGSPLLTPHRIILSSYSFLPLFTIDSSLFSPGSCDEGR